MKYPFQCIPQYKWTHRNLRCEGWDISSHEQSVRPLPARGNYPAPHFRIPCHSPEPLRIWVRMEEECSVGQWNQAQRNKMGVNRKLRRKYLVERCWMLAGGRQEATCFLVHFLCDYVKRIHGMTVALNSSCCLQKKNWEEMCIIIHRILIFFLVIYNSSIFIILELCSKVFSSD